MAETRRRRRSSAVAEPPPPDVVSRFERDLRAVMRRFDQRQQAADEAAVERDRVIRDAHNAGLGPSHIAEHTGLSNERIAQICRSRR